MMVLLVLIFIMYYGGNKPNLRTNINLCSCLTLFYCLQCWTSDKIEYELDMVESAVKSLRSLGSLIPAKERHER